MKSTPTIDHSNRSQVFYSFISLTKKFEKNPQLHEDYKTFMELMINSDFIEEVPDDELNNEAWYLTHHAVYHKQKGSIRVVFNCSLKKNKGISLNDLLYQGPDLTNSLLGVLLLFGEGKIAFMGGYSEDVLPSSYFPSSSKLAQIFLV